MKALIRKLRDALKQRVADLLDREEPMSQSLVVTDVEQLAQTLRKGDVILVEGRTRVSKIIQLFTRSQWSHVALYVGDELLRHPGRQRDRLRKRYGEYAGRMLVEALIKEGVVAAPLHKYLDHTIRVCRPVGVTRAALQRVLESVVGDLGKQYDNRNIVDLALQLMPLNFGPFRSRRATACLGACSDFAVICSGVIAKAFHEVGFAIRPQFELVAPAEGRRPGTDPSARALVPHPVVQHPSQITPRDFDLSPNFEIIKVPVYQRWCELPVRRRRAS